MAKIVGSGAVRVFPVMTGFKKSVSKEMSASGKAGGQSFTASMKGARGKAGAPLGNELGAPPTPPGEGSFAPPGESHILRLKIHKKNAGDNTVPDFFLNQVLKD